MRLARKVAVNSAAQVGSQAFSMVAGVLSVGIAARYLSLEDYGSVIAAFALVSMLGMLTDFGLATAGTRALARAEPGQERDVQAGLLRAATGLTLPTVAIVIVVSGVAYGGAGDETVRDAIWIFLVPLVFAPMRAVLASHAMVNQRVWLLSIAQISGRAVSLALVIAAAALDLGPLGIAAAYASSSLVGDVVSLVLVRPPLRLRAPAARVQARTLLRSAAPLGAILVINLLYFRIDTLLLSWLSSEADVAVYGVAWRVFDMLSPLPYYVMITLLPELARMDASDARIGRFVQQAFSAMWLLALPIAALAPVAPDLMELLAGERYREGGTALALILVCVALSVLNGVLGNALVARGLQAALFKVAILILVVNVALNIALIPPLGIDGAAIAMVATEVLSIVATALVFRRVAPLPRPHLAVRSLTAGAVMAAVVAAAALVDSPFVAVAVAGLAGSAAYVGTLLLLRAVPGELRDAVTAALPGRRMREAT